MSLVFNTKTFTADSFSSDAIGYYGAGKTVSAKDNLVLKRSMPKPTAVFSGVGKTSAKLTRTVALTSALTPTGEAILEISVSVPVGVTSADVDALLNDMGAFLSGANYKTLVKQQVINY